MANLIPKWNVPSSRSFSGLAVSDGMVHASTAPFGSQDWGPFYRLDAESGAPLGFFIGGDSYSAPASAHCLIYVSSRVAVYALDGHTGNLVWTFVVAASGNTADVSDLTVADDMIYFSVATAGKLSVNALNARTGVQVWSYEPAEGAGNVTVADGVAYFGFSRQIDALDARTGQFIWSFTAGGAPTNPAVVKNVAYFGAADGYLYAINASRGTLIWKSIAGMPSASPAVADGRVYALSSDGYFYSFDAKTGKFIWSYATSPCNCYYFAPAVANGVVYYDVDITVYALDARDGTLLWSYDTGGIFGPPVVANGVLYVGTEFSGLWAFGLKGQDSAESDSSKAQRSGLVQPETMRPTSMTGQWRETVIYSFSGGEGCDGEIPYAGLVLDSAGLLHGTTLLGLPYWCDGYSEEGSVFAMSTSGKETLEYFPDNVPYGAVALDKADHAYVTSYYGPTLVSPGAIMAGGATLYAFSGGSDGGNPEAGVVFDDAGDLYGTTTYGGAKCHNLEYCGVVFEFSPTTRKQKVIHTFTGGRDGRNPTSSLIFDRAGNLYGTTLLGGEKDSGVVFELTPSTSGWTEKVLHAFSGGDGKYPVARWS